MKGPLRHATRKCVRRGPRARVRGLGLGFGFAAARRGPPAVTRACAPAGFATTVYTGSLSRFRRRTRRYRSGDLCAPVRCDLLWMSGRCGPESGPVEPGVARMADRA